MTTSDDTCAGEFVGVAVVLPLEAPRPLFVRACANLQSTLATQLILHPDPLAATTATATARRGIPPAACQLKLDRSDPLEHGLRHSIW